MDHCFAGRGMDIVTKASTLWKPPGPICPVPVHLLGTGFSHGTLEPQAPEDHLWQGKRFSLCELLVTLQSPSQRSPHLDPLS